MPNKKNPKNLQENPNIALGEVSMGKILKASLDFYFRRNRRFWDFRPIYSNSLCFRLLRLKISRNFRKDRIETTFCITEEQGCCYIAIYVLKYLLRAGIFHTIFKIDDFLEPKNYKHYYKDKKLILVYRF